MFRTALVAPLCLALALVCASSASASPIAFYVDINTAPLIGGGTFYLDFQMIDGGSPGSVGNSATITAFDFGAGGAAVPPAVLTGGASGDFASGVSLSDTTFFNDFFEGFTPGSLLRFLVTLTTNVETPVPDAFSVAILDAALLNIPTTGPGDSLLLVNISSSDLGESDLQTFRGAVGTAYADVTATAVPEPASILLLGTGLTAAGARRAARRRARRAEPTGPSAALPL